jgi:hypothetical protein
MIIVIGRTETLSSFTTNLNAGINGQPPDYNAKGLIRYTVV